MTEAQVGFLYNIAAAISKSKTNELDILKSYYLMRCKEITRGYGLPDKYFSPKVRCPKCCIEWKNNTEVRVKSIKLSKRQKKRIKSKIIGQKKKQVVRRQKELLNSKEIEQICKFCNKKTITSILKPVKQLPVSEVSNETDISIKESNINHKQKSNKVNTKKSKTHVYANALNIFSMQNKNNVLATTIKKKSKPINNNKKKKDKFAGLCQKAVIAAAKIKEQQNKKQNNLNLFLKPSV